MRTKTERPVALVLRLYRSIALAFPYEFKEAYGDELLQVSEDAAEFIWQRHGTLGLLRLLGDVAVRVPAEHIAQVGRDIRYALRTLASSPGFTAVAVISLTLATCIATCSFSMMNGMVLRVLPNVAEPESLVGLQATVSYPDYQRYSELNDLFSGTMAYAATVPFGIARDGHTTRTWGQLVTPSYFSTLGVQPVLGHFFGSKDAQPGAPSNVIVSYRFWQGELGGNPEVIGKTLHLNGHPVTLIGVGPNDFLGASPALFAADVWMPVFGAEQIAPELSDHALERRDRSMFHVVARLRPGVSYETAEARLDAVARQIERDKGEPNNPDRSRRITLIAAGKMLPMRKQDLPFFSSFFLTLAALVVLIACANLANMMLARSAQRRREVAIRLALGARRSRIIFQLLTESMLIAVAAGVLGFAASAWLMHLLSESQMMPLPIPITYDFTADGRVFVFTLAMTSLTGFIFGLAPAWHATRVGLSPALKEGGNVQLRRFRRVSLRNLLMVVQLASSLTLLVVVGLMSVGIRKTVGGQEGFAPKNLYLLAVDPVRDGLSAQQAQTFLPTLLDRVRTLPGIDSACLTDTLPVAMDLAPLVRFLVPGSGAGKTRVHGAAVKQVVGADYFETIGIPMLQGRSFNRQDELKDASTVIVSATFVREFWGGANPVGQHLEIKNGQNMAPAGGMPGNPDYRRGILGDGPRTFEIVGVARDVTNSVIAKNEHPAIYFPLHPIDYSQPSLQGTTLIVRAAPGTDAIRSLEYEIAAMDSRVTPFKARSMEQHINQFMMPLRVASWTYGLIGVFGLVLAAVGLAGVTAYSVAQRRFEIGVRVALGARRRNVLGLVVREGAVLAAIGTSVGMAGAWAAARMLATFNSAVSTVTSTSTTNPIVLFGAPLLLAALALVACYLPARRSLHISPSMALRAE
jgi:predicted permease